MSAQKTPTLSDTIPAYEILLCALCEAKTVLPQLGDTIDVCIWKIEEHMNIERRRPLYALSISTFCSTPDTNIISLLMYSVSKFFI